MKRNSKASFSLAKKVFRNLGQLGQLDYCPVPNALLLFFSLFVKDDDKALS